MANPIQFTGQTSESFQPKATFMLSLHGATTETTSVKMLPTDIPDSGDWLDAPVVDTTKTLSDSNRSVFVNFAKGYKYRLDVGAGNTIETTATFYWGNATQSNWFQD